MTITEALKLYQLSRVGRVAARTLQWDEQKLRPLAEFFTAERPVETITLEDLWRWRAWLVRRDTRYGDHPTKPEVKGGLSGYTLRGHIQAVKQFFRWATRRGYIPGDPAEGLKMPARPDVEPKAVAREDLWSLLQAARESGPREYAIVLFLADTGCRAGGLVSLTLSSLDLPRGVATVKEKGRGGGKRRRVHLLKATVEALRAWLNERPAFKTDRVFLGRKGPLTPSGLYQILERLAQRAGIEGRFNPHAFRHGFARGLLENGADLGTVSQLLGHSSIEVTHDFYARWKPSELAERHKRFNWLNGAEEK
ncbi:MAG: tyrosine-type recombinase/integrase [Ardenticatenaceae bacterium]|nr:tyrosine-type recombinase/integrase [Ardenticatenaceae bacterium]